MNNESFDPGRLSHLKIWVILCQVLSAFLGLFFFIFFFAGAWWESPGGIFLLLLILLLIAQTVSLSLIRKLMDTRTPPPPGPSSQGLDPNINIGE